MSERTYETWQVMRLLSRHRDWRAEAPETDQWLPIGARVDGDEVVFYGAVYPGIARSAPIRSDWRIIKPKKRASKVVVRVCGAREVEFREGFLSRWRKLDPSKTYKLVEVDE